MRQMRAVLLALGILFGIGVQPLSAKKAAPIDLGCTSGMRTETPVPMNPAIRRGTLDNGMAYFVLKNAEPKNRILLRLVVNAGSCMEEDDQQGIAHLVEHLAFDGTEHFAKSDIVSFMESVGMQNGSEVNAYTSYAQTVYKLEIPADDDAVLERAMLVLHDWACAVRFDEEEVDRERDIVKEEWRLRQGAEQRIAAETDRLKLRGSRFLERQPIGSMDVVGSTDYGRIVAFYKQWYRPDLMAVVAVGDAPAGKLENAIKKAMGTIPPAEGSVEAPAYTVPFPTEKEVLVLTDGEVKYTSLELECRKRDVAPLRTVEQIYEDILFNMGVDILNKRLAGIALEADSPWLSAGMYERWPADGVCNSGVFVNPKEGREAAALQLLITELKRFLVYGASDAEFERSRNASVADIAQYKANIKKIHSEYYANSIVQYLATGELPYYPRFAYGAWEDCTARATLEDMGAVVRSRWHGAGDYLVAIANSESALPSESELSAVWQEAFAADVAAYEDMSLPDSLMERPAAQAKVISKKKHRDTGVTEYVLENGAYLLMKKTNFEKDVIRMSAYSSGGYSLYDGGELPSAAVCARYAHLSGLCGYSLSTIQRFFMDKMCSYSFGVDQYGEYIDCSGNNKDFEIALQAMYQLFMNPQFTDAGWGYLYQDIEDDARNFGASIGDVERRHKNDFLYDGRQCFINHDRNFLLEMDRERAEQIFRERFSNGADFVFTFVGDFNEKELLELCRAYIGSIPGDVGKTETNRTVHYSLPEGVKTGIVHKGIEAQAFVELLFRSNGVAASESRDDFVDIELGSQLAALLQTRLHEELREEQGGVYGVNVYSSFDGYPERQYEFSVHFACPPERVAELKELAVGVIESLKKDGVEKSYTDNLAEIYRRNLEENLRNNGWWLYRIRDVYYDAEERPKSVAAVPHRKIPDLITPEKMQELANLYFDTENYFFWNLLPEGEE